MRGHACDRDGRELEVLHLVLAPGEELLLEHVLHRVREVRLLVRGRGRVRARARIKVRVRVRATCRPRRT